jgi:two-component system, chemotaxis family, protein-glutamate methylesterase/glutaminase
MRVLIAEDDAASRMILRKLMKMMNFESSEVSNGAEAVDKLRKEAYDVLLTDWMMPKADGIELISWVRKEIRPAPFVMMITALDSSEARDRAFAAGANAYITKPYDHKFFSEQLENGLSQHLHGRKTQDIISRKAPTKVPPFTGVGIAASTGGPSTLLNVFSKIRPVSNAAFFIVLHGPAWMLQSFAQRLQEVSSMPVRLAHDGMKIAPGTVYLAPGDLHMVVNPDTIEIALVDDPPENYCRPAADPLFRSIAAAFGKRCVAAVFTGMGRDGSIGAGYIAAAGGVVLAQDPKTATIGSMPQSVIDLRLANVVEPLDQMPEAIMLEVRRKA